MKLIYVAGAYRSEYPERIDLNIDVAKHMGVLLGERGHMPVIPHMNTQNFERLCDLPMEFWLEGTLELMKRCDGIIMIQGWGESPGATAELATAQDMGMDVYHDIEDVPYAPDQKLVIA